MKRVDEVFTTGSKWKPGFTVPDTPKISSTAAKGQRKPETNIKALSKPVPSSVRPKSTQKQRQDSEIPSQHQPNASKAHFQLNAYARQNNGEMVKVSPDMTFEQA